MKIAWAFFDFFIHSLKNITAIKEFKIK